MNTQAYLENLRSKPEHVRRRLAFWWSFGITAVITLFWLASFTVGRGSATTSVAAAVAKTDSPGQSLVAGIGGLGQDIWSLIFGPKKVTYSEVEVIPGTK